MALETKCSYDFQNNATQTYKNTSVDPSNFQKWGRDNLFRTSYGQSHCNPDYTKPKNTAIPNYQGYTPYMVPQNKHARNYTELARECFANPKLGQNPHNLNTTGYNVATHDFVDNEIKAVSHSQGAITIPAPSPAWAPETKISSTSDHFRDPRKLVPKTYRAQPQGDDVTYAKNRLLGYIN